MGSIDKRHFRDNSYRFQHLGELRKCGREDTITVIWCSIWILLVNIRIRRLVDQGAINTKEMENPWKQMIYVTKEKRLRIELQMRVGRESYGGKRKTYIVLCPGNQQWIEKRPFSLAVRRLPVVTGRIDFVGWLHLQSRLQRLKLIRSKKSNAANLDYPNNFSRKRKKIMVA